MKHVCETVYSIGANDTIYGDVEGVCRITGKKSIGIHFDKWVKKTFNDHDNLVAGNIISNEACFCFDEASEIVKEKTEKEKPQRFRTYSHIIKNNEWYCLTKADKRQIYQLIIDGAEIVCLTDTGQKHIFFKHKIGFWQLDDLFITPDIDLLKHIHSNMTIMLSNGFSQKEIITGKYLSGRMFKCDLDVFKKKEKELSKHRGSKIFLFASFMMCYDKC